MRINRLACAATALALSGLAPAAAAQTCGEWFTRSLELAPLVTEAFTAMRPNDAAAQAKLLPALEAALNAIPTKEVKPEACDGNHINAYTQHQFAELSFLRARGVATGFQDNLPLVKQPTLNQGLLAYAVGWIRYEQGKFNEALAAFEKGLAMFPHDHALQNEYLSTLMQLKRYNDVVSYADKVLNGTFDIDDETRAKIWKARGLGLFNAGDLPGADQAMTVSLRYNQDSETEGLQAQVRDAIAAKKN